MTRSVATVSVIIGSATAIVSSTPLSPVDLLSTTPVNSSALATDVTGTYSTPSVKKLSGEPGIHSEFPSEFNSHPNRRLENTINSATETRILNPYLPAIKCQPFIAGILNVMEALHRRAYRSRIHRPLWRLVRDLPELREYGGALRICKPRLCHVFPTRLQFRSYTGPVCTSRFHDLPEQTSPDA
jgi:hypothetical protein